MSDFVKEIHAMFDHIWDCEIDHPVFQDTVGELMEAVIQAYEKHKPTLGTNLAEVGTDCISRQQAIGALDEQIETCDKSLSSFDISMKDAYAVKVERASLVAYREILEYLPSAEPKRGRWIKLDMHRGMEDHKCSVCEQECYVPTCMGEPMYAYCPNCGAEMEVNHESN